ncbi:MAG: HAMP domain-containing histidine kinase [Bdellovibrionales bacterium]|nr:HAMP domain-containing histidine kinase [Bdellovibrionales bacterium]
MKVTAEFKSIRQFFAKQTFALFFLLAVFVNYLPDLAPYYLRALYDSDLVILGTPYRFQEPCPAKDIGDWKCHLQYRFPRKIVADHEAIGLGVVLFPLAAYCADSPEEKIWISEIRDSDKVVSYLKTYQVLNLQRLKCKSDIIVENWGKPVYRRRGYVQGQITLGSQIAIEQVRSLVELSITSLLFFSAFIFILFYSIFTTLKRITGIELSFPPFDSSKFFWLAFILFANGIFFETIFPFRVPFQIVPKMSNFFGMMCLATPLVSFLSDDTRFPAKIRTLFFRIGNTTEFRVVPLVVISSLVVFPPYFGFAYSRSVLLLALLCLASAAWARDMRMFLFGLCASIDALKILMVPFLPASRTTVTYMVLVFSYELLRRIRILEKNAHFSSGTEIALSVAHDIRSPIGTLKSFLPTVTAEGDVKELLNDAVNRLALIANDLMSISRRNKLPLEEVKSIELLASTRKIVDDFQKSFEIGNRKIYIRSNVESITHDISSALFNSMITNLVSNSIKATNANSGTVEIEFESAQSSIEIKIIDNGIGMSPDLLRKIGTVGISIRDTNNFQSVGIGFYFLKRRVLDLGGSIAVDSTEDRGTCVTVCLPRNVD